MILKIKGNKIWFSAVSMLVIVAVITTVVRIASPTQKSPNIKNNNPFVNTTAVNTAKIENMRGV